MPSGWPAPMMMTRRRKRRPCWAGATCATPTTPEGSRAASPPVLPIVARASMKPLATLNRPILGTVDVVTKEATVSFKERTDVTAVPAMGVVAETMMALVLASEALRKFGGDSVEEFRRNRRGYLRRWVRPLRRRSCPPMVERVILVGMMGAGKTTVGRTAGRPTRMGALRLRRPGDGQHRVAACPSSSPTAVRRPSGPRSPGCWPRPSRRRSRWWCRPPAGWCCRRPTVTLLQRSGVVVWLRADPVLLARRVGKGEGRPLLGEEPATSLARALRGPAAPVRGGGRGGHRRGRAHSRPGRRPSAGRAGGGRPGHRAGRADR